MLIIEETIFAYAKDIKNMFDLFIAGHPYRVIFMPNVPFICHSAQGIELLEATDNKYM